MSNELQDRIYDALSLSRSQQEIANLVPWSRIQYCTGMGATAASYLPMHGITRLNTEWCSEQLAAGREAAVLAVLLHERAHQYVGKVCGEWEAHNALFAGICWGLQARAGVSSTDRQYDIQDEPQEAERAQRIAGAIAKAGSTNDVLGLISGYTQCQRQGNSIKAIAALPKKLLVGAGIFFGLLLVSGNLPIFYHMFF